MLTSIITLIGAAAIAVAAPTPLDTRAAPFTRMQTAMTAWNAGAVTEYPIHSSCNATEANQIRKGLQEAILLADHAKQHVLRWGNNSEHYRKYFGNQPTGEVIGNFDKIVSGDKGGVLFRCDNPDGNCVLEGWGGHWRGENGTDETVICPLSYSTRRPLSQMCALGYDVAESATNTFWASDLIHRLYHMPAIGEAHIEHFADDYEEVLELTANNATYSTHDSDTLQYFALEVYAFDIAVPGVGCAGPSVSSSASSEASSSSSAAATASSTIPQAASATSSAASECHTHSNGDVHCT